MQCFKLYFPSLLTLIENHESQLIIKKKFHSTKLKPPFSNADIVNPELSHKLQRQIFHTSLNI